MLEPIDGHHLRIADLGRGTPILMHDGWVASWDLWLPLIEVMQHEWRCVAYDHRGVGASTFPPESISASALVDDVFRVLDVVGIDQCVLAGESLGCLVVEQAVLRDPGRFLGLVLVGGPPEGPPVTPAVSAAVRADYAGYVDAFVTACLPEPDAAPLHRWGCGTLAQAGPEGAVAMSVAQAGVAPNLEAIEVPALVLHGALDAIVPVAAGREVARRIPGAELVVLDDAGHVPIITRPRQVAAAIDDWWRRAT